MLSSYRRSRKGSHRWHQRCRGKRHCSASSSGKLARDKTLGYLAQNSTVDTSHTIYEELLSVKADLLRLEEKIRECENNMKHAEGDALEDLMKQYTSLTHAFETGGGYLYRSELVGVLKGLGFTEDEFSKPVATLSGGQKTRVALGRLLLQNPDLIILDEPTNHLDMNSIAWLETYLLNYKGAVLIVSTTGIFWTGSPGKSSRSTSPRLRLLWEITPIMP